MNFMSGSKTGSKDDRETIIILSRGARLAPLYRAIAVDLARDYRVVVLMYNSDEHDTWRGAEGIVCIDFAAEMGREVGRHATRLPERTSEIERETNLPLYKAASNYLLYRRFAKEYYGGWPPWYDDERQMMEEYVGSYGVLCQILDEYKPVLIVHEAIDLISTMTTFALAYRRNIFNIGLRRASGINDAAIFFYYGLDRSNFICSYLLQNPHLITPESRIAGRELIDSTRKHGPNLLAHVEARRRGLRKPWHLIRDLLRWGGLKHPHIFFRRISNLLWLKTRVTYEIPDQPFILFLMHLQPEASTASQAPRWVDQERIIEQIAINAPHGVQIVVKENPQCYGWRGRRYYGVFADLPNVQICHPIISTQALIRKAALLVTITGSAGLEAILQGTRVAVLGRPFYSIFSGVRTLDSPEQVIRELTDLSWRPETYETECEEFVAAYIQSVHPLGEAEVGRKWPAPKIMGPQYANALRKTLDFINEHELTPQQFDPGHPFIGPMGDVTCQPKDGV